MSKKISFIPNRGARLGHQFVEWLSGYIFCKNKKIIFYHHNFIGNAKEQDNFLNLSFNENKFKDYKGNILNISNMTLDEYLLSDSDDLYLYDFFNGNNLGITSKMIIDENIRNVLREKYFNKKPHIKNDYISVHVRRDDVMKNNLWSKRYININYFINILNEIYETNENTEVKIFSSNIDEDFLEIKKIKFQNVNLYIDYDIESTLNFMINSKILITSNSGLSLISSLISDNNNTKICPLENFWHEWPKECILKKIE